MPRGRRVTQFMPAVAEGHLISEIGQRVRAAREQQHLTQQDLSNLVGMSRVIISKIENGHHKSVNPHRIAAIAGALSLPERSFLALSLLPIRTVKEIGTTGDTSGEVKRVIERLHNLPTAQQQRISQLMELVLLLCESEGQFPTTSK